MFFALIGGCKLCKGETSVEITLVNFTTNYRTNDCSFWFMVLFDTEGYSCFGTAPETLISCGLVDFEAYFHHDIFTHDGISNCTKYDDWSSASATRSISVADPNNIHLEFLTNMNDGGQLHTGQTFPNAYVTVANTSGTNCLIIQQNDDSTRKFQLCIKVDIAGDTTTLIPQTNHKSSFETTGSAHETMTSLGNDIISFNQDRLSSTHPNAKLTSEAPGASTAAVASSSAYYSTLKTLSTLSIGFTNITSTMQENSSQSSKAKLVIALSVVIPLIFVAIAVFAGFMYFRRRHGYRKSLAIQRNQTDETQFDTEHVYGNEYHESEETHEYETPEENRGKNNTFNSINYQTSTDEYMLPLGQNQYVNSAANRSTSANSYKEIRVI